MKNRMPRLMKEMSQFERSSNEGFHCWSVDETRLDQLEATMDGPPGSPYEGGCFTLHISIPDSYPIEPPNVRFVTKIYHPNIDDQGRICLDTLKLKQDGSGWTPILNIASLLKTIRLLLSEPNADDGLMAEIANEYKTNKAAFLEHARQHTKLHATASVAVRADVTTNQKVNSNSNVDPPTTATTTATTTSTAAAAALPLPNLTDIDVESKKRRRSNEQVVIAADHDHDDDDESNDKKNNNNSNSNSKNSNDSESSRTTHNNKNEEEVVKRVKIGVPAATTASTKESDEVTAAPAAPVAKMSSLNRMRLKTNK